MPVKTGLRTRANGPRSIRSVVSPSSTRILHESPMDCCAASVTAIPVSNRTRPVGGSSSLPGSNGGAVEATASIGSMIAPATATTNATPLHRAAAVEPGSPVACAAAVNGDSEGERGTEEDQRQGSGQGAACVHAPPPLSPDARSRIACRSSLTLLEANADTRARPLFPAG